MTRWNLLLASLVAGVWTVAAAADELARVVVSPTNPRYFETADGKPWIPVGCNICFDRLPRTGKMPVPLKGPHTG